MPEKEFDPSGNDDGGGGGQKKDDRTLSFKDRMRTENDEVIYDSVDRGAMYRCCRIFWCGCCEPNTRITTKLVEEERWDHCDRVVDSMAFENIKDVRRQQTCCCLMASFCPLCCCVDDMGDIVLYGSDESERLSTGAETWTLSRISQSFDTFEKITGHLQELHAGWRKTGRHLQRKIVQVR